MTELDAIDPHDPPKTPAEKRHFAAIRRREAELRDILGGRVTAYESLIDRGRREAIVRMKTMAREQGATMVLNVRFETCTLSESTSGMSALFAAEFIAYGTALVP